MVSFIAWGLRHKKWYIRTYSYACLTWLAILVLTIASYIHNAGLDAFSILTSIFVVVLLGVPPLAVLALLARREMRKVSLVSKLDPYLISALDKVRSAEEYFKGKTSVSWSPVISMSHDAILSLLQRKLIDVKGAEGVSIIDKLRREKKLHLSTLAKILREINAIDNEDYRNIEILRDLRNRVVHEDYHPIKEQALWALNLVKAFIKKHFPE